MTRSIHAPSLRRTLSTMCLTAATTLSGVAVGVTALTPLEPAQAYPEPSRYPVAWELDFRYDDPRRIVVEVPGQSEPKAYWYMTYRVENHTDRERLFLPVFELMLEDGRVLRSDRNIPKAVFNRIQQRVGDPLLEEALQLSGSTLLLGEDQQRRGVAIWEEPQPDLGRFVIFVGGLSGEAATPKDAKGEPLKDANGRNVLLFKTLQINYRLLGDESRPGDDLLEKDGERWVMR